MKKYFLDSKLKFLRGSSPLELLTVLLVVLSGVCSWSPSAQAQTATWTQCAAEGGNCTFSGTRQVRYGLNGNYAYKTATSSIPCNNNTFGDPYYGYQKYCSYSSVVASPTPAPAVSWTRCAVEDGTCYFSNTRQVRYGFNGVYAYKTATSSIGCNNQTFGDPVPGADKVCDYSSSTTAPTPAPTPAPAPAPSGTFSLGMRPFSVTSSWNTPVSASAAYTKLNWPAFTGYNYGIAWETYSPAIQIGKASDPLVQVKIPASWGWPAQTIPMRLPVGASGANGTDGEILMIDGNIVHNCWQFVRTSTTSGTCQAYGRADLLNGSGWGSKSPFLSAGIVAAGSSQLAGLLVQAETDAGEINHALAISLDFSLQKPGAVGEAIASDGSSSTGIAQEGDRLAIPPNVSMPAGLSPLGQKIFRAMQKYGVFSIDVAGGINSLRAQSNAYSGSVIDAARGDMGKLMPLLQKVK